MLQLYKKNRYRNTLPMQIITKKYRNSVQILYSHHSQIQKWGTNTDITIPQMQKSCKLFRKNPTQTKFPGDIHTVGHQACRKDAAWAVKSFWSTGVLKSLDSSRDTLAKKQFFQSLEKEQMLNGEYIFRSIITPWDEDLFVICQYRRFLVALRGCLTIENTDKCMSSVLVLRKQDMGI